MACVALVFTVRARVSVCVCSAHADSPVFWSLLIHAKLQDGAQYYTLALSLLNCWKFVFVCFPLGVQVSEVSKASLGQSSIVSSSGPLNSVGLEFEREGRCSTFHLQSRGALCPFFPHSSLNFQQLLLFFLLFQPFFSPLCYWTLLWAPLT